jgi:hypothetical protein
MSCWPIDNDATVTRLDTAKAVSIVARAPRRSGVRWPADRSDECCPRENIGSRGGRLMRIRVAKPSMTAALLAAWRSSPVPVRRPTPPRRPPAGSAGRPDGRDRGRLHLRQVQRERRPEARPEDGHDRVRPIREGSQPVPDRGDAVHQGRGKQAGIKLLTTNAESDLNKEISTSRDGRSRRPGADHLAAQLGGLDPALDYAGERTCRS